MGFKIKISEINFKQKLSQNRTAEDKVGIFKGLENRSDEQSHQVLLDMKNLK